MKSPRRRKYVPFAVVLVAAPAAAFVVAHAVSDSGRPPTLAELAARNYRTLSVAESRRLLRYAETEYACLAAHGARVSRPVASATRITMRAPHQSADALVRLLTACDPEVGPPPTRASLQARAERVLVYVPKRCLLNPAQVTSTAS